MLVACEQKNSVVTSVEIDVAPITDFCYIERCIENTRMVNNDTVTERKITSYVYVDYSKITLGGIKIDTLQIELSKWYLPNKEKTHKYVDFRINPPAGIIEDTMLIELSQTQYLMYGDTLVEITQLDTILRHWNWTAKCFFKEYEYNGQLYLLYQRIVSGDSISDEDILRVMPQNSDQYHVFCSESRPCCERGMLIDSIALKRAKEQPLFIDAYIWQLPWSDGAGAEILYEDYFMKFFQYDSTYFNKAIHRILPEYIDCFNDEWYEYARKYSH